MDVLVGFRFHPTDEEIIRLLENKRLDPDFSVHAITETNIYDFEPGELFGLSQIQSDGKWCSFFCAPDYVNAESDRVHRATKTGYWKLTGKGSEINAKGGTDAIGRKRILVFYERGRGAKGTKTDWVMHQFSAKDNPLYKKDFVVCRVKRNGDKKRRNSTYVKGQQRKKLRISIRDEGQVNHHLAFDNHSHATKNIFPESHLLPSNYPVSSSRNTSISESRNCVEENTSISESRNCVEDTSIFETRNLEEYTTISESRIRVEEYTSFESRDCVEENTSISRNRIEENTSPELQLLLQFLRSNYLISNARNHVGENTSPELQLPTNDYLISESRNHAEENTSPELESLLQLPANYYLISEYRNHAEENTSPELESLLQLPANDYLISEYRNHAEENTSPELESLLQLPANDYLISEYRNRVKENTSPDLELLSQLSANDCLISESRNCVEENTSSELRLLPQFLPSNYMISESRNHVEENTSQELQILPQCLPNNNLISNARNHAGGNISPEQLLPSNFLISNSANQVMENTSPKSKLQSSDNLISNSGNHVVENALPVYSDLPTVSNALEGNELDEASFSTLPLLINQEQGSSYSSFSSSDYPPFGSEWENDFMNPQSVIHDPSEGTGSSILPLYFNSLEAGGGFWG